MDEQEQCLEDIVTHRDNRTTNQPEFIKNHGGVHNFFTSASILTSNGIFELKKVEIDERSPINLLPSQIAIDLGLKLYSGNTSAFTISDRLVQTSQYSRFSIEVAGHKSPIVAGVVSNIDVILLGRDWIDRVNLLKGVANQSYYISIPIYTTAASSSNISSDDIKPKRIVVSDTTIKKYDDFCLSDNSLSQGEESLSEYSLSQEYSDGEDYNDYEEEEEEEGFIEFSDIEEVN